MKIENETSVENKEETSSSQNKEPEKIDDDIVSKKNIDDNSESGVRVNLPKIKNMNVGLIESKNRDRIK